MKSSCVALFLVIAIISRGHGASLKNKAARQAEAQTQPAQATQPGVVTLISPSTPSVVGNIPELVPAVVDPNPTTAAPPPTTTLVPATTPKSEDGEDDDSSEEEEEDADTDDQDQDQDDDDGQDDGGDENEVGEQDEGGPGAKQIYLPGYLTNHGELLVPLDAVQRAGSGDRVQYEVIEDPTYPEYAQFANAEEPSPQSGAGTLLNSPSIGGEGSSAGGIGGGSVETVLDILEQSGSPPPPAVGVNADSEPSEEEEVKQSGVVEGDEGNIQQQRHLWIGGRNPTDFGFQF